MPVDDALRLIEQNFGEYVKKTRQRNMREVVPRDIRNLLLDLLETRSLSMGDLDKLIKYLKERQSYLVDDQIEQKRETATGEATVYMCSSLKVFFCWCSGQRHFPQLDQPLLPDKDLNIDIFPLDWSLFIFHTTRICTFL